MRIFGSATKISSKVVGHLRMTSAHHNHIGVVLGGDGPEVGDVEDRTLAFCLWLEYGFDKQADF